MMPAHRLVILCLILAIQSYAIKADKRLILPIETKERGIEFQLISEEIEGIPYPNSA